ncbi:hypothetical protein E2I00_017506 [Balaenoptera physalus]|uniref:Uncharacterized protein n=1 Tax=Balaenoptera physalus TaxID=9770 RepID=A0A643BRI3_BALPH|nr:hypothetical protein E2I00_017506 [Balaenoptera physalus]
MGLDVHLPGGLRVAGGVPGYTARGSDCPAPEPLGPAAPRAAGPPQLPGGRPPVAGLHRLLPHLPAHLLLPAHGRGSSSVRQVPGPRAARRRTPAPCLPAQRAAAGPLELLAALHRHLFPPIYSQGGGRRGGHLCLVPHLRQLVSSALVSRDPGPWALPSPQLQPQA